MREEASRPETLPPSDTVGEFRVFCYSPHIPRKFGTYEPLRC
jgi:hypothetical protein